MRSWLGRAFVPALGALDVTLGLLADWTADASRTARFLHGRACFEPRDNDVFVSSYPRSGTTWLLTLVHVLVRRANALDFTHLSDVTPWWERSLAYRAHAAQRFAELEAPRIFKTHLPRRWLPRQGRYLYAVRSPEDVAVSYYHLYRRYLQFTGTFDEFFERFLRGDLQYRSWFRHVSGWEAERNRPGVLIVPYEEMRADPIPWVQRIGEFLHAPVDARRAARIAELTDFRRMKAEEHKFDHEGEMLRQMGVMPGAFLREGRVRHGEGMLQEEHRQRLAQARTERVWLPTLEWRLPSFLH